MKDIMETLEKRLDIVGTLEIREGVIVPSSSLTKRLIKDKHLGDLFQYHNGQFVFTNRFMSFVGEIFNRKVKAGHYKLTLE